MSICSCSRAIILSATKNNNSLFCPSRRTAFVHATHSRKTFLRASMVDSYESSADFVKRTEQAWLISQQPRPVACSSCESKGYVECKWCGGTGFFILGDNMLCQVPSRNTSCVICAGKVINIFRICIHHPCSFEKCQGNYSYK